MNVLRTLTIAEVVCVELGSSYEVREHTYAFF